MPDLENLMRQWQWVVVVVVIVMIIRAVDVVRLTVGVGRQGKVENSRNAVGMLSEDPCCISCSTRLISVADIAEVDSISHDS